MKKGTKLLRDTNHWLEHAYIKCTFVRILLHMWSDFLYQHVFWSHSNIHDHAFRCCVSNILSSWFPQSKVSHVRVRVMPLAIFRHAFKIRFYTFADKQQFLLISNPFNCKFVCAFHDFRWVPMMGQNLPSTFIGPTSPMTVWYLRLVASISR